MQSRELSLILKVTLKTWIRNHKRIRKIARTTAFFLEFLDREASYFLTDLRETLSRRKDELIPPKRMRVRIGTPEISEFEKGGEDFLRLLIDLCGVKPNERVLDVGCGAGKMARPLARYLNEQGSYEGFDIVPELIAWDKKAFGKHFPNFRFQQADVYNKEYNPKGKFKASEYKFPYESKSFDFVFLISVFTHMLTEDVENYFSEISRVLKPKGRCLISCFLLNPNSLKMIEDKKASLDFKYRTDGYRTVRKDIPEAAVAYEEETMKKLFEKNSLKIVEPMLYGWWSTGQSSMPQMRFQDIMVAIKQTNPY